MAGTEQLREGLAPADPGVVDKIVMRFNRISDNTGMAGMSDSMAAHFRRSIQGIPRKEAQGAYIDEPDNVRALFNHGKLLDAGQLDEYAKGLKRFEKHSRAGREPFEAFLSSLNDEQEADQKAKVKTAKNFERYM